MTKATRFAIILISIIVLLSINVAAVLMNVTDQLYFSYDNYDGSSSVGRGYTFVYLGTENTYLTGISYGFEPNNFPTRFRFYSGTATITTECPGLPDYQQTLTTTANIVATDSAILTTPQLLTPGSTYTICLDDNGAAWQAITQTVSSLGNFSNNSIGSSSLINYTRSFRGSTSDTNVRAFLGLVIQKNVTLIATPNPTINLTGKNVLFYDDFNRANTYVGSLGNSINPNSNYVSWYGGSPFYTVGIENNAFRMTKGSSQNAYSARVKSDINTSVNEFNSSLDIKVHIKLFANFTDTKNYSIYVAFNNYSSSSENGPLGIQGYTNFNGFAGRKLQVNYYPNTTQFPIAANLITFFNSSIYTIDITYASGLSYIKSYIINGYEYVNPEIDRVFGTGANTSYTNPSNLSLNSLEFWVGPADVSYTTLYDEVAVYQEPAAMPYTVISTITPNPLLINYSAINGYCQPNQNSTAFNYSWYKNNTLLTSGVTSGSYTANTNYLVNSLSATIEKGATYKFICSAFNGTNYSATAEISLVATNQINAGQLYCRELNISFAANDTFELVFNNSDINFSKVSSNNIGFANIDNCSNVSIGNLGTYNYAEWYRINNNTQTSEQIIGIRPNWSANKIVMLYNSTAYNFSKTPSCNNVYYVVDTFDRTDSNTVGTQTCGSNAITWTESCTYNAAQCSISTNRLRGFYINAGGGSYDISNNAGGLINPSNSTNYVVQRYYSTTDRASNANSLNYVSMLMVNNGNTSYYGYGGATNTDRTKIRVLINGASSEYLASAGTYPPANTWIKREAWRTNNTVGIRVNNILLNGSAVYPGTAGIFDYYSIGQTYDSSGTDSPITTFYDDFRLFKGQQAAPAIGNEQQINNTVDPPTPPNTIINVATQILPSILYTNTTLQGYCTPTGDNTNLTLSYELRKDGNNIIGNRDICYQDIANVSNGCGGLSTGSYVTTGAVDNLQNLFDSNKSNYVQVNASGNGNLYINYTIPIGVTNASILIAAAGTLAGGSPMNLKEIYELPAACVVGRTEVSLRYRAVSGSYSFIYCTNNLNTEVLIKTIQAYPLAIYDEAIYWVKNSNNVDILCLQEQPDVATTCGGVTGGSYNQDGGLNSNWIDGNYNTGTDLFSTGIKNLTSTYKIPLGTTNAFYNPTFAANPTVSPIEYNYYITIPESCKVNGFITIQNQNKFNVGGVCITGNCVNTTCLNTSSQYEQLLYLPEGVNTHRYLKDEAVFWDITASINPAVSGTQYDLFNYTLSTSDYGSNYSLYCNATNAYNSTGFITSQADKQVNDLITYNMSLFTDNSVPGLFPEIGDTIQLNGSAISRDNINVCQLQTNVTGTWVTSQNQTVNSVGNNLNVPFTYVITNNSNANNSIVYWRVICNDTFGEQFQSQVASFNVTDLNFPLIIIGPGALNINSNNRTVFSRDKYNLTFNITYFDYNLFAMEINVSCDIDGQLYYFTNSSIGLQNYTVAGQVPLNNASLQKCNFFTAASDSHTDEETPEYEFEKLDNGLSFLTENNNIVQIITENSTVDNVDTTKLVDRQTFEFEFADTTNTRTFKVLSDKPLYYIEDSIYPAHFISWNQQTFTGNWIDFVDQLNTADTYVVNKINDYEYDVIITTIIPTNKMSFASIGGTTITNFTLDFYIGGDINVNSNNTYDGSRIAGFNYQLITTDGVNNYTGWINGNGTIQNVSAGAYNITFSNSTFFGNTVVTSLSNVSANVTYYGFQNQYNFIFRNVKTLLPIYNVSYTIRNLITGWNTTGNTGSSSPLIKYLNNGTYNITWNASGYDTMTQMFTASVLENITLTYDTSFLASFILYDEKRSTLTGSNVLFNVANATSISFLLFCPGETRAQIINSTNFTVPITCNYNLFEFLLTYGTSSYYRAFIIEPDDAFNVDIYLIDLSTTPYLFNSLVADDLLSKYINPRIFVKKVIGNKTVQITANFVDIEQKIGAFLIENNQYIVEIYSDNLPVYVIGTYFADAAGTKSIRLYDVSIYSRTAGTSQPNIGQITVINASEPNSTLFYRYQDDTNMTTSVNFNVYQNNNPVPICTDTLLSNNNLLVACPITSYNSSKITVEQTITRAGQTSTIKQVIKDITEIQLGIIQYFGQAQINWFLIIVIASLALFGTIQTANIYTLALVGIAVLFNVFGWLVMSTSVLAFAVMVALIAIFKEGDKVN